MSSNIFRAAVKEGTFLDHYMDYMSPLETPLSYDFWCGMWLLSSTINRRMTINRPHAPVYLNLYLVICADAGTTRKSSAIRRCEEVYRAAKLGEECTTLTGSFTPEAMLAALAGTTLHYGHGTAHVISSELVTILGKEKYTVALPGLLTDLYDCPAVREVSRAGAGKIRIDNTYVSFLAASTPSWLVRAINPDVIEGGFTSRCLFVIEEQRKRLVAWPDGVTDSSIVDRLASMLGDVRDDVSRWSSRGIDLTDSAKTRFVLWYERRDYSATDPFTASFDAREDHHVLRLAGLLAANERSWQISVHHIDHAIKIIAHHKKTAAHMFGVQRSSVRMMEGVDKVREVLRESGELGIDQSKLLFKTRNKLKTRELEYVMTIMHELEMVQKFEVTTGGRKKTVWRGTNRLMFRNLNTMLQERVTTD